MKSVVWLACCATACAGSFAGVQVPVPSTPRTEGPDHRSWAQRMEDAHRHDQEAAEHNHASKEAHGTLGQYAYTCGDSVLNDQLTTGGFRVTTWVPCWNVEDEVSAQQRYEAGRDRQAARYDRRSAARLVRAEMAACRTIPEAERHHSPFEHQSQIAEVIPHREGGRVRGVWVVFKPVPALTADWMRRDIECQRARWAVFGKDPNMAPFDPTLMEGVRIFVYEVGGHVEVLVTTESDQQAQVALARAETALAPQTASR